MSAQLQAVNIFYSYSHKDERLRAELEKHLALLGRQGVVNGWHDRKIGAGREWEGEINENLEAAQIILLLISADFLASDYCYQREMRRAMERHEAGSARVIPVILRACDWQSAPFGKLQALPRGAKPVVSWRDRDKAWLNVAAGIRAEAERLRGGDFEGPEAPARPVNKPVRLTEPLAPRPKPYIPRELPYDCDRNEQEHALAAALRRQQAESPRRPFVILVHGHEEECHGGFLERARRSTMHRVLKLEARQLSIKECILPWPAPGVARRNYPQVFWQHLGQELLEDSTVAQDEVVKFIAQHEQPVLITSDPLTESFEGGGATLLEAYLDFWRAWPDLPHGRTLLVWLALKHQQRFDNVGRWRRWRLRKLSARLRAYVNALDLSADAALPGVVLPELRGIRRGDVETWLQSHPVRALCAIEEHEIRKLYADSELCTDGLIAMEPLVKELRHLLYKHRRGITP